MWWPMHIMGLDNASGPWYLFWSGFFSALSTFSIFGVAWSIIRRHNCHVHGCFRVGRHPITDTPGVLVCRKHHPEGGHKHHKHRLTIVVDDPTIPRMGDTVALNDDQQVTLSAQGEDAKKQPVAVAMPVSWVLSDQSASGAALHDNGDGTALLVAGNPAGLDVSATDANGLSASLHVDVSAGPAVSMSISEGTPVQQPAPAPAA